MELNQQQQIFIIILVISFLAAVYILIFGPGGHLHRAREKEAKRLETKITVGGGIEIIDEFCELAEAYAKLGRLTDAESTMRKALTIAENEIGKSNPDLIPILKKYAKILSKCNRGIEAGNMLKRAKELSSNK